MKFKAYTILLLGVIFSGLFSFQAMAKSKELPYLRNGVSFSIAAGWNIIANDSVGTNAFYFSAEKSGKFASGLITVTWVNKIEDPRITIDRHQKSMKEANIFRNSGIEFTSVIPAKFAEITALSCYYSTIVKEQKLEGTIFCFNNAQKTITIFFQTGLKDHKLNQKAFELFQKTFHCRE